MHYQQTANIPMKLVGPVKIVGAYANDAVMVPLATFETPLWPSVARGAQVSRLSGGINTVVTADKMTRSVVVEAASAMQANRVLIDLRKRSADMTKVAACGSKFANLSDWSSQIVGNLLYLRFTLDTADASGHNMVTASAERLLNWLLAEYSCLKYVSISANYCTDKKVSAVNGILGRGKYVIAEITVPENICKKILKTTPKKLVDLHIKKNLLGSIIAGSMRSANAHFANMLLAIYLATGQDAANIIEGSQGIVHTEVNTAGQLYFSVTLPNIIVGTVGNGKNLAFTQENLRLLGCLEQNVAPGEAAKKLAAIVAATVLCGELSLLAAQTNPGQLMAAHLRLERMQINADS